MNDIMNGAFICEKGIHQNNNDFIDGIILQFIIIYNWRKEILHMLVSLHGNVRYGHAQL